MCGIVGIGPHPDGKYLCYEAMLALKHRGQTGAGVAIYDVDNGIIDVRKQIECIDAGNVFKGWSHKQNTFYIGHNRFPTVGEATSRNVQPFYMDTLRGRLTLATNGEIYKESFTNFIESNRIKPRTESDTELMMIALHWELIQKDAKPIPEIIEKAMSYFYGAYSTLFMMEGDSTLYAFRDPHGIRPLKLGKIDDTYIIASETCALETIKAEFIRNVHPGEIIGITQNNELISYQGHEPKKTAHCIIENVYFKRPDSINGKDTIYTLRKKCGIQCALEHPVPHADIVTCVPASGRPGAIGFAQQSKIPYEESLIKNPIIDRTYIGGTKATRTKDALKKYKSIRDAIEGKTIVLCDDTIIRGLTAPLLTNLLKENGAKEIHWRVLCPPHRYGCPFGLGYSEVDSIAQQLPVLDIKKKIGLDENDSLEYLSLEGLYKAMGYPQDSFCDGCLTGKFPVTPCQFKKQT